MADSIQIGPAQPEQRPAVLRLAFQHLPGREAEARVGTALELIGRGEFDPAGVLGAWIDGVLGGAMICTTAPGASGLVWPPQVADTAVGRELGDQLVEAACAHLQLRGAELAQALLSPGESTLAEALERNGFAHVTQLLYLRHALELTGPILGGPERLAYRAYPHDLQRFHEVLLRSYVDSQDCPEVTGVRTIEEIIEGHRAQGKYDPEHWWLALEDAHPVAVMLLTESPETSSWDVSYVGLVPEARGRGLGTELLCKAVLEARLSGATQLTLSVDARNQPARALYRRIGFTSFDGKEVYLAIWKKG